MIRPLALCVIRRGDELLAFEGHDRVKATTFYRPLGGGIEFGEYGHQAVAREMHEELGVGLVQVQFLGTMENIFTFEGTPGHEIALIYEARFADPTYYERAEMTGFEPGVTFRVVWLPLDSARSGKALLYPERLLALLDKSH